MNIAHFDVDNELKKYLDGAVYETSLNEITDPSAFAETEAISIKSQTKINTDLKSHFPKLKLLITRTVGVDHIDLDYCKKNNIAVYHIVDYGSFNIAEHVFALLLAGTRNIIHSEKEVKKGTFSFEGNLGIALRGKTIGVIGTGHIGLETIRIANGFSMNVIAYDVTPRDHDEHGLVFEYVSLDKLIKTSDIISIHAPLLEENKHMINEETISQMKDGVILINTARGGLIDTNALVKHASKFRWIGLDVLEDEQNFSKDDPLLQLPNVIITPHIAFYSDESVKKIASETKKLVHNFEMGNDEGRVV
ncbi:MAG TPA: NAD(P)-dependent oxidoreductase [Candidatus Woesebacteria bacterium]|nr:NAD(P)-dependent oxidoreductase [Candidatus Woesebacteria bacterium]